MAKRKKEIKVKEPVRIREKVLGDGTISLYLDMYHKGNRKKEGLKLYIIPETTPAAKLQNKNTRRLAEQIKAQRILDIQKDGLVDWEKLKKFRTTLVSWLEDFVTCEAQLSPSGVVSKRNAKVRVEEYLASIGKPDLRLSEVDREFCRGFVAFLRTCKSHRGKETISETTARLLMYRIAAAMDKAVVEGLIPNNPFRVLEAKEKPKIRASRREFLTVEELKVLINTPCRCDIVKRAFLFSCFTGLRYSDMKSLLWSEIHTTADGKTLYIEHRQVKTKKTVTIPLSDEALRWMPKQVDGIDQVFHELKISTGTVEDVLKEWMKDCKIDKHITYHCSRHTAATTLLTLGANLYVVSKLMGHSCIQMTEVYAKIVDQKKVETMNLVNNLFTNPAASPESQTANAF
ncbi:MAG: site-specific integrase [Bacteroidales bacterium]|nr:site-specific integrase [Bacteroidales bacterium]MCI2135560.1 site-specific integrase [Bacteroidales bacterium]MDY6320971.1 site-specific integrase [Bacteroidales bacterium]